MPFDAVIFDLDGTLADTLEDIAQAMNAALAQLGFPQHTRDEYRLLVGQGVAHLAEKALPGDRTSQVQQAMEAFRAHYSAHLLDHTRAFPGIPALLDALVARGQRIAVLSNKFDELTRRVVSHCFGRWPFSPVFGERQGVPRKPDPAAALEIARALQLPPARIAFVGDTRIDVETAVRASMYGVGVLWGFRPREELEAAGARAIAGTPDQLREILGR